MKDINVLCNDMLLLDDIHDTDYEYCHEPDTIGIATNVGSDQKRFFVYRTDERGVISWIKEKDTFKDALLYARKMYKGILEAYLAFEKEIIKNNHLDDNDLIKKKK